MAKPKRIRKKVEAARTREGERRAGGEKRLGGLVLEFAGRAARALASWLWEWSWMLTLFAGCFIGCALWSYSPNDTAFTVSSGGDVVNWCGHVGAWLADVLFNLFGRSAWWLVLASFMSAIFAARTALRRHNGETDPERLQPPHWTAAFGFIVLLVGSSCLEALRLRRFAETLPGEPGGLLGEHFAFAGVQYIGVGFATVLFIVLIGMGLSLLMDFRWSGVAEVIGRLLEGLFRAAVRTRERTGEVSEPQLPADEPVRDIPIYKPEATTARRIEPVKPQQAVARGATAPVFATRGDAPRPELALLDDPDEARVGMDDEALAMTSRLIVSKLKSYGIDAQVKGVQTGPVITQYWLEPGPGVKGSQIEGVRDDLRRVLGVQAVRVVPSIPGTAFVGLEVPNPVRQTVRLKEILSSDEFASCDSPLTLAIGKDIAGKPFTMDLAKTPHLLVAGTTGSGKSVGINAMILSMLYRTTPEDLRLVLIDPKMLEFSMYEGIPHLLCPVVVDMNKASVALKWLCAEMDRRYETMSRLGVRQFSGYNEKIRSAKAAGVPVMDPTVNENLEPRPLEPWPYIVCVVDELADLMLTNRKEVEGEITRLTQKARAAGIHLILATQRPSVDVVTSLIKANVPSRIAFQVASGVDSRVILGESGAEQLLGYGDMLMHRPGMSQPCRIQGCFVADAEVQRVVDALKATGTPQYVEAVTEAADEAATGESFGRAGGETDALYDRVVDFVVSERKASVSLIQRHFGIGYNRAANIMEALEAAGVVSAPKNATGKRDILVPQR